MQQFIKSGLLVLLCLPAYFAEAQEGSSGNYASNDIATRANSYNSDTARIMNLCREADKLWYTEPDSGINLASQALQLSRETGFNRGAATALMSIGISEVQKGNNEKSIRWFREAFNYCIYPSPDVPIIIKTCANMGMPYYNMGRFDSAAFYYYNAIELAKKTGREYTRTIASTYGNLSIIWMRNEDQDKAFGYLLKGAEIARKKKYYDLLPFLVSMKAAVSHAKGDDSMSFRYGRQAAALAREYNQPVVLLNVLVNLSDILTGQKKGKEALAYVREAIEVGKGLNIYGAVSGPHFFLGKAYYQLKQYKPAEAELLTFLKSSDTFHMAENQLNAFHLLADIYSATGRYDKAYQQAQNYIVLSEDLAGQEKDKVIHQLEVRSRILEKDKEIAGKQVLITRQESKLKEKNFWIGCSLLGSLLLGTSLLGLYRSNRNKQRLQLAAMRAMQQEREITQLKAQIRGEEQERTRIARELHDGIMVQFSAVKMNLSALIKRHTDKKGIEDFKEPVLLLDNATRELRRTAHNLMPDMLLEEGLAEAVYFFCRNLQQSVNIAINFQLYGQVPRMAVDFELAVYRIIQELVHNVIKHAQATHALVQISCQQKLLMVTVEDDGTGIAENVSKGNDSMGLKNVHTRVAALKGHIDIHSGPQKGTIVYIEFDIDNLTEQTNKDGYKTGDHG